MENNTELVVDVPIGVHNTRLVRIIGRLGPPNQPHYARVNELEVYVMCEIPSNVTLAKEFAEVFDGFSIGSNDLTQLVLGVDRDSALVAHLFDERNEAVKRTIAQVIHAAQAAGRKIGICGQAPSDYPEFARFLVTEGIDSLSLNPDSVLKTMLAIVDLEGSLARGTSESP